MSNIFDELETIKRRERDRQRQNAIAAFQPILGILFVLGALLLWHWLAS